jgi:hypothetical protein
MDTLRLKNRSNLPRLSLCITLFHRREKEALWWLCKFNDYPLKQTYIDAIVHIHRVHIRATTIGIMRMFRMLLSHQENAHVASCCLKDATDIKY